MQNKIKLKAKELFYMLIVTIPPLLMLFIPNYATIFIGVDAWLLFLLLSVIDVIFAFVIVKIGMMSENKTVVGMLRYAFGNVAGTVFSSLFVILFAFKSMMVFRQAIEYIYMTTHTLEPIYYFAIPMIAMMIFSQYKGINSIVRISGIIFFLMVFSYFMLIVSAVKDFDLKNLMPILDNGITPVIQALPHFFTWSGNAIILLVLFKKTEMSHGIKKFVMAGCAISYAIVFLLDLLYIGVFGVISGFITSSVLELSLFMNSEIFFGNFDAIIEIIWVFSTYLRDSILIYCTIESFSELVSIKNKRIVNTLIPLALTVPALITFRNEEMYFIIAMGTTSIICGIIQYGGTLLLWAGLKIKTIKNKRMLDKGYNVIS